MPTAIGRPSSRADRPRRRRMSIAVTMRPRKLSTPAISGGDNGTRVKRSGRTTSCTCAIGMPNNWPPAVTVTNSMRSGSAVSFMAIPLGGPAYLTLRLQRGDQALPIGLDDVIAESCLSSALIDLGFSHRRQRDDRQVGHTHITAHR